MSSMLFVHMIVHEGILLQLVHGLLMWSLNVCMPGSPCEDAAPLDSAPLHEGAMEEVAEDAVPVLEVVVEVTAGTKRNRVAS